ncbi:MAG: malate permease [Thermoleophilaceae bacterium]|nr:malate permease [Thermoleophilaceae bacterium]
MIPIAAVIGAATAAGVRIEHRRPEWATAAAGRLMSLVLWVVLPIAAFFNLAALHLSGRVGAALLFAYAATTVTIGAAYLIGTYVLRLPRGGVGALMCVAVFGNTGYLGLPFTAALFGFDALGNAVVYDTLVSAAGVVTVGFSIGAGFGTIAQRPVDRLKAFFARNPPLWASAAGLLAPSVLAPHWAVDSSRVLVMAILPIGFFAVGVTLSREAEQGAARFPPPLTAPVAVGIALKLLVVPGVLLLLSTVVVSVPEAYLTQAAMASGINTILIADEYGLDRALTAAVIAWTTAIVVAAGLVAALV